MSKDNYPCMFSRKLEAFVIIIFQMFVETRAVLKTGEYHSDLVSRFDQIECGQKCLMIYYNV